MISKSKSDHQKIEAVFFDKANHMETRSLPVGDNERLYPTDCVSCVSLNQEILYIALNKRNKASEPHACEITAYNLVENLSIGFITK